MGSSSKSREIGEDQDKIDAQNENANFSTNHDLNRLSVVDATKFHYVSMKVHHHMFLGKKAIVLHVYNRSRSVSEHLLRLSRQEEK